MRLLLHLALAGLLCTCARAEVGPPPADLAELAPVLAELQLVEGTINEIPVLVRDSIREVLYENVLADHGTTRTEFDSVMWLIRQEPVWVDSLYTRAGDILAARSTGK